MEKEKIAACKQHLQKAAHWSKAQLTPQRLRKGAGLLLTLAILAGGGKIVLHQQKAQAHAQEAQARTEMLQNLAAQKNIQLVSADQVKETIASTLGTNPSSITFHSVTLDDRKPGQEGIHPREAPQFQMVKTARADAFHGIYIARCEKDGMRYNFLVDAQSGQVLRGQVHKMNPIQRLFS